MSDREWNEKQSEVIEHRGGDLIVSAAAGSGKTAVLVERIVRLITDDENPVDIDDILVVTFTNAAATEMKNKIASEIDAKLLKDPSNIRLSLQSALIGNAIITTIDSFCGYVVKNYFPVIGLEPGYKVGEEEELSIMAEEVLDETMESFYSSNDKDFKKLVRSYGKAKGDKEIRDMVQKLCRNAESHVDPEAWLKSLSDYYDTEDFEDLSWVKELVKLVKDVFAGLRSEFERGLAVCREDDGPRQYISGFESDIALMDELCGIGTYGGLYDRLSQPKLFETLKGTKPKDCIVDEDKKEKAKNIRDAAKKVVTDKVIKKYFSLSPAKHKESLKKAKPFVEALSRLAIAYSENLMAEKKRKKLYGFSDIEHFALEILTHEETDQNGNVVRPIAKAFGRKFKEVMIDEYQDSNDVQETILSNISDASGGKCKRFMVGDVKQSIYGFRLANPEIFLEKEKDYSDPANDKKRIVLCKNYRSRSSVLDAVNVLFENIMKKDTADIDYDGDARLYKGSPNYDDDPNPLMKTELLLGYFEEPRDNTQESDGEFYGESDGQFSDEDFDDDTEIIDGDKLAFEAKIIAKRINELKAIKNDKGEPLFKNSDFAILSRSFKKSADILLKELANAGINAHLTRDKGYFSEVEIKNVMNMLEAIDNPLVDIPLYGALVSPFGFMEHDEITEIRIFARDKGLIAPLFEQIKAYIEEGCDDSIKSKLECFLESLEHFRKTAVDTSVRDLIESLIIDTGYRDHIAAKPAGKRRVANLEMLLNIAKKYDENTAGGIFKFVRHIRQMRTFDMDYGEADNVSEADDVVRLMTIHKSKGLQFRVVFLAGIDNAFSNADSKAALKCSEKYGAAIRAIDPRKRVRYRNLLNDLIALQADHAQKAEEMRILYVAMTRAEEKLIMVGPIRQPDKRPDEADDMKGVSDYDVIKADRFSKWIEPVARAHRDLFEIIEYSESDVISSEKKDAEKYVFDTARILALGSVENEFTEDIKRRIGFTYRYTDDITLRQKVSVSEVKKPDYEKAIKEEGADELIKPKERKKYIPKFKSMDDSGDTARGAAYGSSVHRFMELLDYGALPLDEAEFAGAVRMQLDRVGEDGLMDADAAGKMNENYFTAFLKSDLGREMRKAFISGTLRREAPFVMETAASEIYPDIKTDETILVQGIIDAYYVSDDGIVVVDYKTDSLEKESYFVDKYHRQLELYGQALSKAIGKPVAALYIYSFHLEKMIGIKYTRQ